MLRIYNAYVYFILVGYTYKYAYTFVCETSLFFTQHSLPRQALHVYNISCIVVTELRKLHWWHHFKVKVKGQGHIMVKVGCQRNPYFLSSSYQILSDQLQTWCESSIWAATQLINFWCPSALTFMGLAAGRNLLTPRSNFEIEGTTRYHIVLYIIWKVLMRAFQINKNFDFFQFLSFSSKEHHR
jgi:hypothetical protein